MNKNTKKIKEILDTINMPRDIYNTIMKLTADGGNE